MSGRTAVTRMIEASSALPDRRRDRFGKTEHGGAEQQAQHRRGRRSSLFHLLSCSL